MIDIDIILLALKIGILVLLYLFIWRVVRSVVANVRQGGARAAAPAAPAEAFPAAPAIEPWEERMPHAGAAAQAAAPEAALLVVEQSRVLPAGRELRLDGPLTLGRAPASDVVLDEAVVSGAHARLIPVVGGCDVEDLGSTNGTFVDGQRVSFASLRHGSALRIGDTVFRYREASRR